MTILVVAVFFIAGLVKGVVGLGLPTVSLALLTTIVGLPSAMALLVLPSLVTNVWQALVGGALRTALSRTWPFLLTATLLIWVGGLGHGLIDVRYLTGLLGALLVLYAAIGLTGRRLALPASWARWAGPVIGAVNGILTGLTGSFVFPGVLYLQALGLPRTAFIQAMGLLFSLSTLALALSLHGNGAWSRELGYLSAVGIVPAIAGMVVGQMVRNKLPEAKFRIVFFLAILMLGAVIVVKAAVN